MQQDIGPLLALPSKFLRAMWIIVLGAQWGDEGKGKLVDVLCPKVKFVARVGTQSSLFYYSY